MAKPTKQQSSKRKNGKKRLNNTFNFGNWQWVFLGIAILFNLSIRLEQINLPLERDEGEFGYIAQTFLRGEAPYQHAYSKKLPGVPYVDTIFLLLFGQSSQGMKAGILIVNMLSILFVFFLTRKLYSPFMASFSALAYSILSVDAGVFGNASHATQFINLFVLASFIMMFKFFDNKKILFLFISGFLMGVAFTMKQHAVFFLIFGCLYVAFDLWKNKEIDFLNKLLKFVVYSFAIFVPYLIIFLIVIKAGIFNKFWFWTFEYAKEYGNKTSLSDIYYNLKAGFLYISDTYLIFWLIAALGLFFLINKKTSHPKKYFLIYYLLFSFFCIVPDFIFRNHYFIVMLPPVSMLIGYAFVSINEKLRKFDPKFVVVLLFLIFMAIAGYGMNQKSWYYFSGDTDELCKNIYPDNPFVEARTISDYIKQNTTDSDKIAVLGSEAEVYFYTGRKAATGYIYTYGLVDKNPYNLKMQKEMSSEIENSKPKYLIYFSMNFSWLSAPGCERYIFNWLQDYSNKNMTLVCLAEMVDANHTVYNWGSDAYKYKPVGENMIYVFKRKV